MAVPRRSVHPRGHANGYGKRTPTDEYRPQQRGGSGIILIKAGDRNGAVVAVRQVVDESHIMVITSAGVIIRMVCSGISMMGRNTQGVRIVRLDESDTVSAVAHLAETGDEGATRDLPTPTPSESDDGNSPAEPS